MLGVDVDKVPWSFLMALASLALIGLLYRQRRDVFTDLGLNAREVALLCLGSIAGWAVNVPLLIIGGTYLAVNVGGALVPLLVIGWWIRHKKLRLLPTLLGTLVVTLVAWKIVEFSPESGIIARFPLFFLPIAASLLFGLLVSIKRPVASVPVVYASGTLGALIGADLLHVADIRRHFLSAPENTIISIGGAGVFDMVFLAGTFAMALNLGALALLHRRIEPAHVEPAYPPQPYHVADADRVWRDYQRIQTPNPLERAIAGLALSDHALRAGDYDKSVRMSWLAVDSLLQHGPIRAHVENGVDPHLKGDLETLRTAAAAVDDERSLRAAGEANLAAKTLVAALAPRASFVTSLVVVA